MISFGAWKKPFSVCRFQNNRIGRQEKIRTKSDSDSMFLAPQVGLEPTTLRLTAECSAIELLRNVCFRSLKNVIIIPPRLALVNPFFIFFQLFCCSVFFFITKGLLGRNRPVMPDSFPSKNVLPCASYPSYFLSDPFPCIGISLCFCTKSRISARKHVWDVGCTLAGFSAYML